MVSSSSPEVGLICNKITRCKSLKKYNSTRLEGVQLQDEHTPLEVQDFHHEDVSSMLNLKMTLEAVLHSFVQFGACKTWPYAMP